MAKSAKGKRSLPNANLLIRASAGTGKTFQLAHRYLALLERGVPPERILATTFTRKAAAEILDRIITRLATASLDDEARQNLASALQAKSLKRESCMEMLLSLLHNLHRLRISTLDSLFAQFARSFSLELGLPPGWRIIDEAEEIAVRDLVIDSVLRQEETGELLSLTHLLTKGEASRGIAQLIRDTVVRLHGLYLETTAKAWHSIQRPKQLSQDELNQVLDELSNLELPEKRAQKARDEDCARARAEDWDTFLEKGLAAKVLAGELTYYSKPIPAEAVPLYERLIDQARAIVVNRVVSQTEGSFKLLHHFNTQRRDWQYEHRGLRFDDITQSLDLATRSDDSAADAGDSSKVMDSSSHARLAHRLDGAVAHLLLDEFQDTSPRQWRALQPFVRHSIDGDGESSFFCVGDVKQAIYGWRGGVAEIFDAIEQQIPGLELKPLTHSYRSSQPVIDFVNEVFQNACRHPRLDRASAAVEKWCSAFQKHSTERTDLPGYACLQTARAAGEGEDSDDCILQSAAELIARLFRESPDREIGVLVRTNESVGRIVHLLRERSLPASEEGGNPLTDSAAVQVVLSYLRMADHPGDTIARFHVAESPLGAAVRYTDFRDDRAAHKKADEVRRELQCLGYGPTVQKLASHLEPACGERDRKRLEQLVERAYAYQSRATLRADDFIQQIETECVAEPSGAAIRVMTIHQSKGLEFDIVVLPELECDLIGQPPTFVVERLDPVAPITCVCRYANSSVQKLMPQRVQKMFESATDRDVSEAMCVLYVALTRAIHALHVVIAPSKSKENSFPRTMAGLLRASLVGTNPTLPEAILHECGDREWNRRLAEVEVRKEVKLPEKVVEPEPVRAVTLAAADQRRRGLDRISPSGLEGGNRVRMRRWSETHSDAAAVRGTVMHACLQQVHWIEDGPPAEQLIRETIAEALRREGQAGDVTKWWEEYQRLLATPTIQSQLRRELYRRPEQLGFPPAVAREMKKEKLECAVETERTFAVHDSGGLMSGSIDRLVTISFDKKVIAADIIDFKTDTMPEGDEQAARQRADIYWPQIEAYKRAVGKMFDLEPPRITARLIFTTAGVVIPVK